MLLVLLSCVAAPAPALGSTVAVTSVETRYGDTRRDGPPREVTVGSIAVIAAPGERNELRTAVEVGDLRVSATGQG